MLKQAKLSNKCQITVPKQVRDILGISKGDDVMFYIENDEVKLTGAKNLNIRLKNTKKVAILKNGDKNNGQTKDR